MSNENLVGYLGKATVVGREVISRLTSPQPFVVHTATSDGETWQGSTDEAISQVLLIANPQNVQGIRFSLYEPVGATNYIELFGQDSFELGGILLSDIHLQFVQAGDSIHLAYSIADGELEELDIV